MYVNKSYKQRDNTWSPMKLVTEPIVYSRPVSAGSFNEAVHIIRAEAQHNFSSKLLPKRGDNQFQESEENVLSSEVISISSWKFSDEL